MWKLVLFLDLVVESLEHGRFSSKFATMCPEEHIVCCLKGRLILSLSGDRQFTIVILLLIKHEIRTNIVTRPLATVPLAPAESNCHVGLALSRSEEDSKTFGDLCNDASISNLVGNSLLQVVTGFKDDLLSCSEGVFHLQPNWFHLE
jgi:hypothetical protein